MRTYLAGPMSGLPAFNFPLFHYAAKVLRAAGMEIISPAETDPPDVQALALASPDGKYDAAGKVGSETWGDMLARDVKMLADGVLCANATPDKDENGNNIEVGYLIPVDAICFLPNWEKSKGARLEAFVGLLCGKQFFEYDLATELALPRTAEWVQDGLMNPWLDARRRATRPGVAKARA